MNRFSHGGDTYGKNIRLDFSVNTAPLGADEKIISAVTDAADLFGVYPDIEYRDLRKEIAKREGADVKNVVCSNGASEMIFAVARAVMPKTALLISPSFSEYERALLSVGAKIRYYDLYEEDSFSLRDDFFDALRGADMAFVCSPNNPTGNIFDKDILEKAAKQCGESGALLAVDECFADLAGAYSMKGKTPVIKAFTKTYALAGLRLGYLIADEEFAERVKKQLPAWNVSAAAERAGIAAAKNTQYLRDNFSLLRAERAFLSEKLNEIGVKVFKSEANFMLIKGAAGIDKALLKRGILIRSCANFRGLNECFYRIAIKTRPENAVLIKELGDICG